MGTRYKHAYFASAQESGFVAYQRTTREVLIVVQGSMSKEDSLANANGVAVSFEQDVLRPFRIDPKRGLGSLREYKGYSEIVVTLWREISEVLANVTKTKGNISRVIVSGHSLGAAVAAGVLEVLNNENKHPSQGYLFAQPDSFKG